MKVEVFRAANGTWEHAKASDVRGGDRFRETGDDGCLLYEATAVCDPLLKTNGELVVIVENTHYYSLERFSTLSRSYVKFPPESERS